MDVGKMVSQGAHVAVRALLVRDATTDRLVLDHCPDVDGWLANNETKIVVEVKSEEKLLNVYQKAMDAGLRCSIVRDITLQKFTAVAIGPAPEEMIDPITKRLRLLKFKGDQC